MWLNPQFSTYLVKFADEIFNAKLYFLCSVISDCLWQKETIDKVITMIRKLVCNLLTRNCFVIKSSYQVDEVINIHCLYKQLLPLRVSLVNVKSPQETTALFRFTTEILNVRLLFLSRESSFVKWYYQHKLQHYTILGSWVK